MARIRGVGRAAAIVASLVLAAVATFAIWSYIQGIEDRAMADAEPVEVFVAEQEIPAGITAGQAGEAGLIERSTVPRGNVPDGAIGSLDQISGLVTDAPILPGEVLVRGRWVDPEEAEAGAMLEIPEDFEAVSVQVGIPPGVAGFVRPGDQVSLIVTTETPGDTILQEDGTQIEEAGEVSTQYLLQGIQVLSVGQRITTEEGEEDVSEDGGNVLLTVALEPEDAERLVFAIENASLYFTLLPEDAEPADTPGRSLDNLFDD